MEPSVGFLALALYLLPRNTVVGNYLTHADLDDSLLDAAEVRDAKFGGQKRESGHDGKIEVPNREIVLHQEPQLWLHEIGLATPPHAVQEPHLHVVRAFPGNKPDGVYARAARIVCRFVAGVDRPLQAAVRVSGEQRHLLNVGFAAEAVEEVVFGTLHILEASLVHALDAGGELADAAGGVELFQEAEDGADWDCEEVEEEVDEVFSCLGAQDLVLPLVDDELHSETVVIGCHFCSLRLAGWLPCAYFSLYRRLCFLDGQEIFSYIDVREKRTSHNGPS
ncbi:unnamed protein product [Linum trigynum]|uniref:Secreted protein n=1 Tax=Linum trigynum TaxID=586398 RepID=A0AAV2EMM2_9ROSI